MAKKVIAFDLDDTLTITKSPITDRMGDLLVRLLGMYDVCIISGADLKQLQLQVLDHIEVPTDALQRLHLMPTCGTRYYRYDAEDQDWSLQYSEDLADDQKQRIREVTESVAREMGIWPENPAGEVVEDRYSQMTMAALGQQASPEDKYAWAENNKELRYVYRDKVAALLPDLEVRVAGTTSTDITLPGIDKAYGMRKLMEATGFVVTDILFVGDKLQEGGNDYPVKALGIDTIEVDGWQTTAYVVEGILGVS